VQLVSGPAFRAERGDASLRLKGELDMASVPMLEPLLDELLASSGPIFLDVAGLSFMDSSGVGLLVKTAKAADGRCVIVHGARGPVAKVLEMTRIDAAEDIHILPCTYMPAEPE
jgi:anti-sigma B factor antagonist